MRRGSPQPQAQAALPVQLQGAGDIVSATGQQAVHCQPGGLYVGQHPLLLPQLQLAGSAAARPAPDTRLRAAQAQDYG